MPPNLAPLWRGSTTRKCERETGWDRHGSNASTVADSGLSGSARGGVGAGGLFHGARQHLADIVAECERQLGAEILQ